MKRKIRIVCLFVILCVGLGWCGSLVRCEILTVKHREEFADAYKQTNMIANVDAFKVLRCSGTEAEVYYISKHTAGHLLMFKRESDGWALHRWETVWSKSGSADGWIWPYLR